MLANACDFQCRDCTRAHILCAWYECSVSLCCEQFFSLLKFYFFVPTLRIRSFGGTDKQEKE